MEFLIHPGGVWFGWHFTGRLSGAIQDHSSNESFGVSSFFGCLTRRARGAVLLLLDETVPR